MIRTKRIYQLFPIKSFNINWFSFGINLAEQYNVNFTTLEIPNVFLIEGTPESIEKIDNALNRQSVQTDDFTVKIIPVLAEIMVVGLSPLDLRRLASVLENGKLYRVSRCADLNLVFFRADGQMETLPIDEGYIRRYLCNYFGISETSCTVYIVQPIPPKES
jgi:hypothetical protein